VPGLSFASPTDETRAQLHEAGPGWVVVVDHAPGEQPTYHPFGADDVEGVPQPLTREAVVETVEGRLQAAGFVIARSAEEPQGTVLATWELQPATPAE